MHTLRRQKRVWGEEQAKMPISSDAQMAGAQMIPVDVCEECGRQLVGDGLGMSCSCGAEEYYG